MASTSRASVELTHVVVVLLPSAPGYEATQKDVTGRLHVPLARHDALAVIAVRAAQMLNGLGHVGLLAARRMPGDYGANSVDAGTRGLARSLEGAGDLADVTSRASPVSSCRHQVREEDK
jgi:hypothetical protein